MFAIRRPRPRSGIDSLTYQPKDHVRQNQAHSREREIPPGRPFHLAINLLAIHRYGESESPWTLRKTRVGVDPHGPVPVGNGRLKAARFPSGAWLPGDFLSIDNQPLQAWPILQLDDVSFILGLPRGLKHSEPPSARRNVTSYQVRVRLPCPRRAPCCASPFPNALPPAPESPPRRSP